MRELSLDHLRTLVVVADLGSLARAAGALHLAAPTVTVQLAELESRLGGRLLVRGRGPVQATALGERFIARARRLLADADDAVEDVRRQLSGQTGRVRVGASTGAIAHLLPPALERLARDHPGIDVNVQVLTSSDSMARLAVGSLDLAVVALPQAPVRGVQVIPLRREPVAAVLPAAWKAPRRLTPQWLAARPLILNDASTHLYRLTAEWFSAAGLPCRPRIELNYNDAIRTLVAAGYGAALLPQEPHAPAHDPRIAVRPLSPALWRQLGLAVGERDATGPTGFVLEALLHPRTPDACARRHGRSLNTPFAKNRRRAPAAGRIVHDAALHRAYPTAAIIERDFTPWLRCPAPDRGWLRDVPMELMQPLSGRRDGCVARRVHAAASATIP